jgi:hypothetical protein
MTETRFKSRVSIVLSDLAHDRAELVFGATPFGGLSRINGGVTRQLHSKERTLSLRCSRERRQQ